jgi:hypothetical protein
VLIEGVQVRLEQVYNQIHVTYGNKMGLRDSKAIPNGNNSFERSNIQENNN